MALADGVPTRPVRTAAKPRSSAVWLDILGTLPVISAHISLSVDSTSSAARIDRSACMIKVKVKEPGLPVKVVVSFRSIARDANAC